MVVLFVSRIVRRTLCTAIPMQTSENIEKYYEQTSPAAIIIMTANAIKFYSLSFSALCLFVRNLPHTRARTPVPPY